MLMFTIPSCQQDELTLFSATVAADGYSLACTSNLPTIYMHTGHFSSAHSGVNSTWHSSCSTWGLFSTILILKDNWNNHSRKRNECIFCRNECIFFTTHNNVTVKFNMVETTGLIIQIDHLTLTPTKSLMELRVGRFDQ